MTQKTRGSAKLHTSRELKWRLGRAIFAARPKLRAAFGVATQSVALANVGDVVCEQLTENSYEVEPSVSNYLAEYAAVSGCAADGTRLTLPHLFRAYRLRDVQVLGHTGAILQKPGGALVEQTQLNEIQRQRVLKVCFRPYWINKTVAIGGPAIILLGGWKGHIHYAHFILESFRLLTAMLKAVPELHAATLIVRPNLPAFQRIAFKQLRQRYPLISFFELPDDTQLMCDTLFVPFETAAHTLTWFVRRDMLNDVRDIYLDAYGMRDMPQSWNGKLYLSRNRQKNRRLINEAEVWQNLEVQGYDFYFPETLSHREQVALFQSARSIIAPSGSALATTLFCRPNSNVSVIGPSDIHEPFWVGLALAMGHQFTFIPGSSAGWRRRFTVDLRRIADIARTP